MSEATFQGYPPPKSNVIYCPNQFFDVVLPHSSRGVVRLVGYMIRRVFGSCDRLGMPQDKEPVVSWNELEHGAGIGRARIGEAIAEAVAARFIRCVRPGSPHRPGQVAVPAQYELCFDERPLDEDEKRPYITDPEEFQGFYAGEGCRTNIPQQFFDHTLRTESLAVIRVVGAIVRNTIGYRGPKYGERRQAFQVSFTELERITRLSRRALNLALHEAIDRNHVVRLEPGYFDPQAGQQSRKTVYGLKWTDNFGVQGEALGEAEGEAPDERAAGATETGSEPSVPKVHRGISSKSTPGERFQKYTGQSVPEVHRERFQKYPGERFQKYTGIEIDSLNTSPLKQQQQVEPDSDALVAAAAGSAEGTENGIQGAVAQLTQQGFDTEAATSLAKRYPAERILRQCDWISHRSAERNRLGLLRRAIEQDWPEPRPSKSSEGPGGKPDSSPTPMLTAASVFAAYAYAGLAGNNASPTAVPSPIDIEAARPFVDALLSLSPDETGCPPGGRMATWGRQFGAYVKQLVERAERTTPPRSIATALRTYGDGFQVAFQQRMESQKRQSQAQLRKAHQERFTAAHYAYLKERRDVLQAEHPELWQRFVVHEAEQRRKIAGLLPEGSTLRSRALESFDTPTEELTRLLEFFKGEAQFPILSFWDWDSQLNLERLELQAA